MKPQLTDTVKEIVPAATLVSHTSPDSLKFCLPFSSQSKFAELFRTLEKEDGLQVILFLLKSLLIIIIPQTIVESWNE